MGGAGGGAAYGERIWCTKVIGATGAPDPVAHSKIFRKIRKKFIVSTQHQCMLSQKFKSKFKTMLKIQK